jgi:hypothetical protein
MVGASFTSDGMIVFSITTPTDGKMIPAGYMKKRVSSRPDWLKANDVTDIYSVSSCVSEDFDDYINYWKHNGYWFFNSPETIDNLAISEGIDLKGMTLFYYEVYEKQYDDDNEEWQSFEPEKSFETDVVKPEIRKLEGFDVVSFSASTSAECSPLSCNHMAQEIKVNSHCLLNTLDEAKSYLVSGLFKDCEPGPYRIVAVYIV